MITLRLASSLRGTTSNSTPNSAWASLANRSPVQPPRHRAHSLLSPRCTSGFPAYPLRYAASARLPSCARHTPYRERPLRHSSPAGGCLVEALLPHPPMQFSPYSPPYAANQPFPPVVAP
ncbi:MAG: hypothetical protein AB7S54_10440 [Bacteroidales bacterium]